MGNLVDRLERENATATFNVVITPTMESVYRVYLQTVGIVSSFLSVLLIFLIIFRFSSKSSARLQFDMIALQICFLIFNVHICCLFIPKSTLPYFAGYCMGLVCGAISFHVQFIFAIMVILETLAMFFICLLQRFVILTGSIRHSVTLNAIKISCIIVAALSTSYMHLIDVSEDKMIQYIERTPQMMWLVEKNSWVVYLLSGSKTEHKIALAFLCTVMISFPVGSIILIKLISNYISNMSSNSSKSHANHTMAIRNLILQFTVFCFFLCLPLLVILIRLLVVIDSGTIVFLISESILCSHGLANSIVAIAFNSNFRRVVIEFFSRNTHSDSHRTSLCKKKLNRLSMHPLSLLLLFVSLHSSQSLLCYHQPYNGEQAVVECDTFCYTNVRITDTPTGIPDSLVTRGCSNKMPWYNRFKFTLKFGIVLGKPVCPEIGSINNHYGEFKVIERLCCGSDLCNVMPELR